MKAIGIDIGGSGMKGAVVDCTNGELLSDRLRVKTPEFSHPDELVSSIGKIIEQLSTEKLPIGLGFPGVTRNGSIQTAANLSSSLIGFNLKEALSNVYECPISVINDADAAGVAEMKFGAGQEHANGVALLVTVGTGIGTVLFTNNQLVPNLEMGHVEFNGMPAEKYISERVRKEDGVSWKQWALRFSGYINYVSFLLQPDLIIFGGGGVKKPEKFEMYLEINTPFTFARFGNQAGIIGAALSSVC